MSLMHLVCCWVLQNFISFFFCFMLFNISVGISSSPPTELFIRWIFFHEQWGKKMLFWMVAAHVFTNIFFFPFYNIAASLKEKKSERSIWCGNESSKICYFGSPCGKFFIFLMVCGAELFHLTLWQKNINEL